jgi:signal transduction histidine kinase
MALPGFLRHALARPGRHWLLLAVLVLLHLVIVQGVTTPIGRMLFVGHIGLFLLWQPIVHGETELTLWELVIMAGLIVAAVAGASWGLLILWVMLLAGIVSGRVFFAGERLGRLFYLAALAYLVVVMLVLLVPRIVPHAATVPTAFDLLATWGPPLLFLLMALLPAGEERGTRPEVIDFVYSAFVFLILAVLVLGTLASMLLTGLGYGESLLVTLLGMSLVLLLLGWAWNPRIGFAGIGMLISRYILSRGVPFDEWLQRLTDHALAEGRPEAFLDDACRDLARLPGVAGALWTVAGHEGGFGSVAGPQQRFEHGELTLTVHSARPLSPTLTWHVGLLIRLIGEFFVAKQRAEQLQRMSYVQAVHETGARLTHDVKNLLQSLHTLCFAAAAEGDEATPRFQALLRRQLPAITQRLQQTLDKLRRPNDDGLQRVAAQAWWDELRRRWAQEKLRLTSGIIEAGCEIPGSLFTSVVENLVQNALNKRRVDPALTITVTLDTAPAIALAVCDDGEPLAEDTARQLFRAPVASATGLGIGLYQAARQAELAGYRLTLLANEPGRVCFGLIQASAGSPAPAAAHSGSTPV